MKSRCINSGSSVPQRSYIKSWDFHIWSLIRTLQSSSLWLPLEDTCTLIGFWSFLPLLVRWPSIAHYLKVDIEKYFFAKRNEDVTNMNGLQNVGETRFDSLSVIITSPCHGAPQELPVRLKVALRVAAVCLGGRYWHQCSCCFAQNRGGKEEFALIQKWNIKSKKSYGLLKFSP